MCAHQVVADAYAAEARDLSVEARNLYPEDPEGGIAAGGAIPRAVAWVQVTNPTPNTYDPPPRL